MTDQTILDETDAAVSERRTVLTVWGLLLDNIEKEREEKISPALAMRAIGTWPRMDLGEVPVYLDYYYDYLSGFREVLREIVKAGVDEPEIDGLDNRQAYLDLLFGWHVLAAQWELGWDVTAPYAYLSLAAHTDAFNLVLGGQGLVAHLDEIAFEFTQADNEQLVQRLQEWKAAQ